ncbi:MAG: hypothetical protein MUO72_04725 [Bacteroidales bacterium]|nr:hypothetical protein [Bacteroidales bacterium]
MKALIKVLNWLEWISAVVGVIFMLFGAISIIIARPIMSGDITSFFHAANSCFLLAILLFLFIHFGQHKKE